MINKLNVLSYTKKKNLKNVGKLLSVYRDKKIRVASLKFHNHISSTLSLSAKFFQSLYPLLSSEVSMDRVHLADHQRKAERSERRLRRRRRHDNPHDKRVHTLAVVVFVSVREVNRKRERNGGDRDCSPPVARTRVSALDRHADAAANRGRPLAAPDSGGRAAARDWPAILFYPTSHGSQAAPAKAPSRGFAPDATCFTKFLREPPRFCQCTKRTRVRQIRLSLEKKKLYHRSAEAILEELLKYNCIVTIKRRRYLSWKSHRWQISLVKLNSRIRKLHNPSHRRIQWSIGDCNFSEEFDD